MSDLYEFRTFRLDPDERQVTSLNGTPVPLTPKAFDILVALVRRAPRLVSKQQLLSEVWQDSYVEEANLAVHISAIRRALGEGQSGETFIETVPRHGYRFVAPVELLQATQGGPEPLPAATEATEAPVAADAPASPDGTETEVVSRTEPAAGPRWLPRRLLWRLLLGAAPAAVFAIVAVYTTLPSSSALRGGAAWERMATQGRLALIVSSEARLGDPALSADGRMLAYVAADAQGAFDLFVTRVGGGGQLQLTHDQAREDYPRFSPDGEHILFTRRDAASNTPQICLVPTLGGRAPRVVTNGVDPAWSPDGDRVAFIGQQSPDTPLGLFTSALDGSDIRLLLSAGGGYPFMRHPAWSRDGREIAVVRGTGGIAGEIWLVPSQGGTPQRFTQDRADVWSDWPTFVSDNSGIVHTSNRGGATNLWIQMRAHGVPIRLTTGPGPDTSPTVSRDGTVAFLNSRGRDELFVHDLGNGRTQTLQTHSPYLWGPVFSPDGREIAFSRSEVDGSWHVWTMAANGGNARRLTWGAQGELHPRYTADGQSIIYHSWGRPHRIWRVSRDGGTPVPLTAGDADDGYADPSPDGRWLAFARMEGEERVYIAPLAGNAGAAARRLMDRPSTVPRWSPDGRLIAFSPGRGFDRGIFVIAPDGHGERRLTDRGGWPVWWPDGARISYIALGPDGSQQIWTVPLASGEPRLLETVKFNGSNYPFALSRDGTTLVSSRAVRVSNEIWMLERPGSQSSP